MKCELYSLSRSLFIVIVTFIITIEWNTMEEAYHTAHQQVNQEFARLLLNLIHHEGKNV